jgi:hypothetical protein
VSREKVGGEMASPGADASPAGGAFAAPEGDLSPEDRDRMIESVAGRVVARGLGVPAVFLLEMHKPLCFFGSQLLLLGSPILGPFIGFQRLLKFSALVESRENVERLIRRIEEITAGRKERAAEDETARDSGGKSE